MKLKTILCSLLPIFAVGCEQTIEESTKTTDRFKTIPLSEKIEENTPYSTALKELYEILEKIDANQHRNKRSFKEILFVPDHRSRKMSIYKTLSDGNVDEPEDTAFFVVNFDNEEGYAILMPKSVNNVEVLAVIDDGYCPEDLLNITALEDIDLTDRPLYSEQDSDFYIGAGTIAGGGEINTGIVKRFLLKVYDDKNTDFENPAPSPNTGSNSNNGSSRSTIDNTKKVYPMLTTKWHQRWPFNCDCPIYTGGQSPAGCVNIALLQIMAYHEFPTCSSLGYNCNWASIKSCDITKVNENTSFLSEFTREIGRKTLTIYGTDWAFATPAAACNCLKHYGYKDTKNHWGYDEDLIISMLKGSKPVFIAALSPKFVGHAWVIDGYIQRNDSTPLFHCNWGWNGVCNGYYLSGVFDTEKGAVEREANIDSDTKQNIPNGSHFTWWWRIISYKKPNL